MQADEMTEYASVLVRLGRGRVHDRASEALAEVVAKIEELRDVADADPKGTVQVTLTLEAAEDGAIRITPKVTHRVPSMPLRSSLMFGTAEGGLTREDPRQEAML